MKKGELSFAFRMLAEWTGLEPATPGVTGRYSNQLNYHSLVLQETLLPKIRPPDAQPGWWVLRGSNPRHSPCKGDALPAELSTRQRPKFYNILLDPAKCNADFLLVDRVLQTLAGAELRHLGRLDLD